MIRIKKSEAVPLSLQKPGNTTYNGQDVQRQLLIDHNEKCYLCEQHLIEDFEIEHFQSQRARPDLIATWSNLLFSCGHCNGKKSNRYDDILNPTESNIEVEIEHRLVGSNALFVSTKNDQATQNLIKLLERIFNGTKAIRDVKEGRFFTSFWQKILHFLQITTQYLSYPKDEIKQAIEDELDLNAEFLAFKYHIITNNTVLLATFSDSIVWNKQ